jgi:DNA primase
MMSRSILPGEKGWRSSRGYKTNYLFGALPKGDTIILTEGCFDILTPGLWGRAVATLGTSIGPHIVTCLISNYKSVVLWWDPDAREKQQGELYRLKSLLQVMVEAPTWRTAIMSIEGPEPGSLTPEEAKQYV